MTGHVHSHVSWQFHRWPFLLAAAALIFATPGKSSPPIIRLGYGGASAENLLLMLARPDLTPNQNNKYTIEATRFEGTDRRFQAFEAGAIDIAVMNGNGALFAAGEDIKFKMIASLTRESPRGANVNFMVRSDSKINSVNNLKGKSIGIVSLSSNTQLQVQVMLERNGMSIDDVKLVPTPFPAMYEALKSGLLDVGSFPQPFLAMAKHLGNVRTIFTAKDAAPYEEELIVLIAKDEYLRANRPSTESMLADLIAATKFYTEHTQEARKALIDSKMVRIDPQVFYEMEDPYHQPDLQIDIDGLKKMQDLQIKAGFQKERADLSQYVDLSYLPH
jgi:ABC-type nitrate/sulfonate/bicarbonate transport system substrate-binding protein